MKETLFVQEILKYEKKISVLQDNYTEIYNVLTAIETTRKNKHFTKEQRDVIVILLEQIENLVDQVSEELTEERMKRDIFKATGEYVNFFKNIDDARQVFADAIAVVVEQEEGYNDE